MYVQCTLNFVNYMDMLMCKLSVVYEQELMSAAKWLEGASNSNMFCKPICCRITPLQTALYGKPL